MGGGDVVAVRLPVLDSRTGARLNAESRLVLNRACDEANRLHHPQVRSEHILLALLRDHHIRELLFRMGMTNLDIRMAVDHFGGRETGLSRDEVMGVELRDVLASTLEEVAGLGHHRASNVHLLLGLMKVDGSVAGQVLESFGAGVESARHEVLEFVAECDGGAP